MVRKPIKTDAEVVQEIWMTCEDLRDKGVDLAKIQIVSEQNTNISPLWPEFFQVCEQLRNSGSDLSRIPIMLGRNA